jgi:hypothetical protein
MHKTKPPRKMLNESQLWKPMMSEGWHYRRRNDGQCDAAALRSKTVNSNTIQTANLLARFDSRRLCTQRSSAQVTPTWP